MWLELDIVENYDYQKDNRMLHSENDCVFKKCCKKYKEGKRCKKCPKR